jgi:hypothetical protein
LISNKIKLPEPVLFQKTNKDWEVETGTVKITCRQNNPRLATLNRINCDSKLSGHKNLVEILRELRPEHACEQKKVSTPSHLNPIHTNKNFHVRLWLKLIKNWKFRLIKGEGGKPRRTITKRRLPRQYNRIRRPPKGNDSYLKAINTYVTIIKATE